MRRRAVGLRGFVYFVGTHTRSTVPLGRSAAALGAIIEGPQTLVWSYQTRVGKGLREIAGDLLISLESPRARVRMVKAAL